MRARRDMRERPRAEGGRGFPVPLVQIPPLPLEVSGREMLTDLGEHAYGGQRQVLRASVAVKSPHE
ncbi:MAG: hypothetical protein M1389_05665 [Chloroflexi bacterium]|nr:hypothetical protein [Chloroflexota bacterium]